MILRNLGPNIGYIEVLLHLFLLIKLMGVVKWIQPESNNSRSKFPATRTMAKSLSNQPSYI